MPRCTRQSLGGLRGTRGLSDPTRGYSDRGLQAILATLGGTGGLGLGVLATSIYTRAQSQPMVIPLYALLVAPAAGLLIGSLAGLYPAAKAPRLSPTEALRAA